MTSASVKDNTNLNITSDPTNTTESNTTLGVTNTSILNVTHPRNTTMASTTIDPNTTESNNSDPNNTTLITSTATPLITKPNEASVSYPTMTASNTTLDATNRNSSSYNVTASNTTPGVTSTVNITYPTTLIMATVSPTITQLNGASGSYPTMTKSNTTLNVTDTTTLSPYNTTQPNTSTVNATNPMTTTLNTTTVAPNVTLSTETSVSSITNIPSNTTPISPTTSIILFNFTTEQNTTAYPLRNFTTPSPLNVTQAITNTTLDIYHNFTSPLNTTASPSNYTTATVNNVTLLNTTMLPNITLTNKTQSVEMNTTNTTTTTVAPNKLTAQTAMNSANTTISSTTISTTISTTTISTTSTTTRSSNGTNIAETTTTVSPQSVANQLLNQSQDVSTLNSSQVQNVVSKLEDILSAPSISLDVGQGALSVVNKMLDAPQAALATSSNRLIKVVDELALKLVIPDKSATLILSSLALAVTKIDGSNFAGMSFSLNSPSSIEMTSRRRRSVDSSSLAGSITLPASLTDGLSPDQKKQASRLQFTFFQKSTLFHDKYTKQQLNSFILGTSVANLSITGLRDNVEFSLKNTTPIVGNLTCVFWDFKQNGGAGGWNKSGCFLLNSTDNEMKCSCNHLTSFAVLMDISRGGITDQVQGTILTFITYIGCGISAIFLSITLLTYLAFDKLRRDIPSKILIQLCFALFLLNMVFLIDSWLALYTNAAGLCISTAFFLHYFLLASFTWMGLEALHLYLSIVKVFKSFISHYMLKFSLAGWGIPLIVVIIVISVDKHNYGLVAYGKYANGSTDDFCWLTNNIAYYVSVVAYFCVIFVANLIMFVVVMVQLRRIKRQNPQNNQYRKGIQDLRSIAGLIILLGLTWGFAFFAWGPVNLAFMYLFTIFNSFQGLFIFMFHCVVKENVRRQWRTYLCCGRFRLAENSDWSRGATQNTKKSSVITANISHSSFNPSVPSRNSSMSSDSLGLPSSINPSPVNDSGFTSLDESNNLLNDGLTRRSVR
ncbi:adhesion G-protein coupled receptor G2 [Ictalurus furcatus]|uniref:adhesion G-protein coupled receptor G2 n=1 Tax=Ictalurus furcatus TaxID=66913 RepID=UPI002350758E|nr:adhesion G-protein coupled receptor G2 [Ictalurus furcatus]